MDTRDRQQIGVGRAYRTCQDVVAKKRAEVSWLRGVKSVMSQCGKFEFNVLVNREPMKMLKDGG